MKCFFLLNIDYIEHLGPDADNYLNDVLNPLNALNFERFGIASRPGQSKW